MLLLTLFLRVDETVYLLMEVLMIMQLKHEKSHYQVLHMLAEL